MAATLTARRIVFPEANRIALEEYELPAAPGPGEMLVESALTLISPGTELATLQGHSLPRYPNYPGYSYTGVVVAVGEGVERFRVGDRVYTQRGHCSHAVMNGEGDFIFKIPDGVSFEAAACTTLFAVALYAVRRAQIAYGESVLILGSGLVGQLALRLVRRSAAHPLAIADLRADRLMAAEGRGADHVFDLSQVDADHVRAVTFGQEGYDVVIDATGNAKAVLSALDFARRRGRVVLLGSPHGDVSFDNLYRRVDRKDLTLIGAHQPNNPKVETLSWPWSQRRERQLILELLASGKIDIEGIPYETVPPRDAENAYARLRGAHDGILTRLFDWRKQA